jgi:uncharacterized delta-60 repeat protein
MREGSSSYLCLNESAERVFSAWFCNQFVAIKKASMRLAAAIVMLASWTAMLAPPSFAQVPGSLDTSFANGGRVLGLIGSGTNFARRVAVQPDGRIVLAGTCDGAFCMARFFANGQLDLSFDGPDAVNPGNGKFSFQAGANFGIARALAIQPDGKIVVAGECFASASPSDFCVARLHPNGSFDDTFDGPDNANPGNGRFLLPIGPDNDFAYDLLVQPDGKIVLAGYCSETSGKFNFCFARLTANGALDASFDGTSAANPGNGKFRVSITSRDNRLSSIALQPDGKLIAGGSCNDANNVRYFCAARLNTDGSFDVSFDGTDPVIAPGDGAFLFSIGSDTSDGATGIALQADGKIVIAGSCSDGGSAEFCVARLNADGSFDEAFDGSNAASPGNGRLLVPISAGTDLARALRVQPDGKIVVAGICSDGGVADFCFARLNSDGSVDASFDGPNGIGNGRFLLSVGGSADDAYSLALQPDGKIVVGGECAEAGILDFCLVRLNGGEFGAKHCSLDLDGDGVATAETDGLISTRVALGLRGEAVLNGLSFAANATRNSWPRIRNYLVSQCGMAVY